MELVAYFATNGAINAMYAYFVIASHISITGWPRTLENRENGQKKISCREKSGNLKK